MKEPKDSTLYSDVLQKPVMDLYVFLLKLFKRQDKIFYSVGEREGESITHIW